MQTEENNRMGKSRDLIKKIRDTKGIFHARSDQSFSRVRLLATPWTTAYQPPPSLGFSRQEYWSGVPSLSLEMFPRHFLLKRSLVFLILLFSSISLHCSLQKAFLPLLALIWNSVFSWLYLCLSPLPFASFLFSAICKASSENHLAFLHFFFLG